jgi:hypothetical protein
MSNSEGNQDVNNAQVISIQGIRRSTLVLAQALIFALVAGGCNLMVSSQGVEAVTPSAVVNLSPDIFCVGETLTATYNGGPQVSSCGSTPDSQECKGAELLARGWGFPFGFEETNLHGSVSGPADVLFPFSVTYQVEWENWSHYRDLRVPAQPGSGATWTGRVSATDSAQPLLEGGRLTYFDRLVCDEETHTVRFGRDENRGGSLIRNDAGGVYASGDLSACAAIDQVCISESDAAYRWRLSATDGPSVVLGGPDNPRCTDAFRGYQPQDISLEAVDLTGYGPPGPNLGSPCNPADFNSDWLGVPIVEYEVAGSNLCAINHDDGELARWNGENLDGFQFGSIPLQPAARERCLAALDPAFVAQIPLTPVDVIEGSEYIPATPLPIIIDDGSDNGEPDIATICDLANTCGDGVCQAGCENAITCSQDCQPSEANCPSGTYYAPVTNRCIQIQIPTPKEKNGNDGGDGGRCPTGQSWKCNMTKFPPVCSCQ